MTLPGEALEPTAYAGFYSLIRACDFRAVFGGGIPTESWSFSSEKSYSPSKLTCSHEMAEWLATAIGGRLVEAMLEKQVIPADDGILDKTVAGLGDLLLLLVSGAEFTRVADGDSASEPIA